MRILVTGSSGLIGTALLRRFRASGHEVARLRRSRDEDSAGSIVWSGGERFDDPARLDGFDAVIHLAGENIAGRWTVGKKRRIMTSRRDATRVLCDTLASRPRRPTVFISSSAVGYYGDRGDEILTEESVPGGGFLAEVCVEWESATAGLAAVGTRVAQFRTGIVLSTRGGALARLLPLFRLGLGARIGSGRQYMTWIQIEDLVEAMHYALQADAVSGPVNAVAPGAVTNAEFTRTLGFVLSRPTPFAVPAALLRLVMGEAADAMLLASQRVLPARLLASGFSFRYPQLEEALRRTLAGV